MKRKQVWRYYCEFCKKSGCSGGHIRHHEEHCTANPDRKCGFHEHEWWEGGPQPAMADLIAAINSGHDWDEGMKALREVAENCPACILAAIKQSGAWDKAWREELAEWNEWGDRPIHPVLDFSFKDAAAAWLRDMNPGGYD